jgi:beta-glucanase (GH16 family)
MHLYSFVFLPESIEWYVDDTLVYSVAENNLSDKDSLPINAGKIIMNFWPATGIDEWSGHYEENTTASVVYSEVKFEELRD